MLYLPQTRSVLGTRPRSALKLFGSGGNSCLVAVPNSSTLDGLSQFSVACWLYTTAVTTVNIPIVHRQYTGNYGFVLYLNDTGGISASVGQSGTSTVYTWSDNAISANAWHPISLECTGALVNLFIDGTLQSQQSAYSGNTGTDPGTPNLSIGDVWANAGTTVVVLVQDVHLSNINRHSASYTVPKVAPQPDANTLCLYRCDEGGGRQVRDAANRLQPGALDNWGSVAPFWSSGTIAPPY